MAKYLVLTRFNAGQAHPADVKAAGTRAKAFVQEHQANGDIEAAYTYASGGGGAAIVNANSLNDLHTLLAANPSASHVNHEIHELADFSSGYDQMLGKL